MQTKVYLSLSLFHCIIMSLPVIIGVAVLCEAKMENSVGDEEREKERRQKTLEIN